jgi:hypothetical protein
MTDPTDDKISLVCRRRLSPTAKVATRILQSTLAFYFSLPCNTARSSTMREVCWPSVVAQQLIARYARCWCSFRSGEAKCESSPCNLIPCLVPYTMYHIVRLYATFMCHCTWYLVTCKEFSHIIQCTSGHCEWFSLL